MILYLILLLLLAWVLQQKMGQLALRSVHADISADRPLADPGEPCRMTVTLENRSRLPILFLTVTVTLPEEAETPDVTTLSEILHTRTFRFSCYLLPGQRLERRVSVTFPRRGVWTLGGLQLAAGDLLGLKEDFESRSVTARVVVAPAPIPGLTIDHIPGGLMGDQSVRRWIHEDPILSAGYREYTGREPQRAIAWTRSLASGQMMVRSYDHTTDRRVRVILLLQPGEEHAALEVAFSAARTICEQLEENSIPYSFTGNGELYSFLGTLSRVENGLGRTHLLQILETLGRAGFGLRFAPGEMIRRETIGGDPVQGYLLIVTREDDTVRALADELRRRTDAAVHILTGSDGSPVAAEGGGGV